MPLSYHSKIAEAQEALDAYNRNKAAGLAPRADKFSTTLGDVYAVWSPRKFAQVSPQAASTYKSCWVRLSRYQDLRIKDITIDDLQAIIDEDAANHLSESSMNNDKMLMNALFRYAMKRDIIMKNYAEFVEVPRADPKYEKGAFTDLQIKQLEELAKAGFPWADSVLMLCYTGFRVGEFLALTQFSYDRSGNFLRGGSKTEAGKERLVPVHPKVQPYLLARMEQGGATIFCRDNGKPMSDVYYRRVLFREVAEEVGLPQATPHWCRHTFATRLHMVGAPELDIKRLMGHANSSVTEGYTHTDIQQLERAISLLA